MRSALASALALILSTGATTTGASAQSAPSVEVALGPAVQARADELGRSDLSEQAAYLQRAIASALRRLPTAPTAVRLQIVDIEPNRPTSAQLGASTQLSPGGSFGTGGAAIVGEIDMADGRQLPVRYRFFQDQLRNEVNFTTWGDADQAFDDLAHAISVGRPPNDTRYWPAPHVARAVTGTRIPG